MDDRIKKQLELFEAYETAEAKFAHAMDNLQPLISGKYKERQFGRIVED